MAQKTNPLAFRSLNNFKNSFFHQQVYKKNSSPYVLKEHKIIRFFINNCLYFKAYPIVRVACETFLTLTGVVAHGVDAKGIGATCSWFQTFIDVCKKKNRENVS